MFLVSSWLPFTNLWTKLVFPTLASPARMTKVGEGGTFEQLVITFGHFKYLKMGI